MFKILINDAYIYEHIFLYHNLIPFVYEFVDSIGFFFLFNDIIARRYNPYGPISVSKTFEDAGLNDC